MSSEDRRKSILQVAKELFAQKGFLGVTTRELASAIGVTEPVLYEHFTSKRTLYDQVLLAESSLQMTEFRRLLRPHEEARDDEGFFREAGRFFMDRNERDPAKLRFLLQVLLEGGEAARFFYEKQSLPTHTYLRDYIDKRIAEGAFTPLDARVAARQFVGFVTYHVSMQQLLDDSFLDAPANEVLEEFVRNFLRGLRPR
jgi:AcrR family transcriptional regulator